MALICNKLKGNTDRDLFMAENLELTEREKLRTFYFSLLKKLIVYIPVNNFSVMSGCFPGLKQY